MTQAQHYRWQQANQGFVLRASAVPKPPVKGLLLKNHFAIISPNVHLAEQKAGDVNPSDLSCWSVAQVVQSNHQSIAQGQWVMARGQVAEYFVATSNMWPIDPPQVTLKHYLSALGEAGLTAYFALLRVGLLQAGQKVMIANAGSLTGLFAIQISQLKGCEVIAVSRSKVRAQMLSKRFGILCLCPDDEDYKRALADQYQRIHLILDLPGRHCSALLPCLADQGQWVGCINTRLKPNADSEFSLSRWQTEFTEAQAVLQRWLQRGLLRWQASIEGGFSEVAELMAQQKADQCMGSVLVKFD